MKRLLLTLLVVGFMAGTALAAVSDTGIIRVTCQTSLSVEVSTSTSYIAGDPGNTIDLGTVQTGATCIAPKAFYVWNTSPASQSTIQSYQLSAAVTSGGVAWGMSSTWAVDADTCAVAGSFGPSAAPGSDFTNTEVIDATPSNWTAANHMNATPYATNRHANTVAGTPNPAVLLWTAVKTPSAVSDATQKTITITVTAVSPS